MGDPKWYFKKGCRVEETAHRYQVKGGNKNLTGKPDQGKPDQLVHHCDKNSSLCIRLMCKAYV